MEADEEDSDEEFRHKKGGIDQYKDAYYDDNILKRQNKGMGDKVVEMEEKYHEMEERRKQKEERKQRMLDAG